MPATNSTSYEDLALRIEASSDGGSLLVRVLRSPAGPSDPVVFHPPFPGRDSLAIWTSLESRVRQKAPCEESPGRGVSVLGNEDTGGPLTPQRIGGALFESLFAGALRENLLTSLALIHGQENLGLRIRLVIDPAVTDLVSSWPWELLYRAETRDFLGRDLKTPIVRQLEVRRPSLTPKAISRLDVLIVLSDADPRQPLNVVREKELIEAAVGGVPGVALRFLDPPTIDGLRTEVRRRPFDILHFVGHGWLDRDGHGAVLFRHPDGGAHPVSGIVLADTLKSFPESQASLVVLNACDTARLPRSAAGHDPFSGTASVLIMAGIPAVVAMQFPISDRAALCFSGSFYRSLAAGDPLEGAVAEGRKAVFRNQPASWEWATPVLFLGVPDGRLFSVAPQRRRPNRPRRLRKMQLPQALDRLSELDRVDPSEKRRLLSVRQRRVEDCAGEPQAHFELGLAYLDLRLYEQALASLKLALETGSREKGLHFYIALASLGGRNLREISLPRIKEIEGHLHSAQEADGDSPEVLALSAIIKDEYYRLKKFHVKEPQPEELLAAARRCQSPPGDVDLLPRHLTIPARLRKLLPSPR
jgi:hypothetical protein